jgi:predicted nucleic acid-binding protein
LSPAIVLDADFLSAFLKIDQLSLVRDFYGASILRVPPAVYREVSMTSLVARLASTPWVQVEIPTTLDWTVFQDFRSLGRGEQEAILLARRYDDSLLLMNDLKAQRIAQRLEVSTVDIPAFLLSCKLSGHTGRDEIQGLITALQEKDRYGFRKDVLERLLS